MNKPISTTTSILITALVIDIAATAPLMFPILILLLPLTLLAYAFTTILVISRCRSAWKSLLEHQTPEENRWSQFSKVTLWISGSMVLSTVIFVTLKSLDLIDKSISLSNTVAMIGIFFMLYFFRFFGASLIALPLTLFAFVKSPLSQDRRRCLFALAAFTLSLLLTVVLSPESFTEIVEEPVLLGLSLMFGAPYGLAVGSHLALPRS